MADEIMDNIVLRKKKVYSAIASTEDTVEFAFGIDSKFVLGMGVLMYSILKNNVDKSIGFHVFIDKMDDADMKRLEDLHERYPSFSLTIYYLDIERFNRFSINSRVSCATYFRFIIPRELYGIVKNVIYLDADVLCVNEINNIWTKLINSSGTFAVSDLGNMLSYARKAFAFAGEHYFNAGILFIDIDEWNQHNISERAFSVLKEGCSYKYLDQDLLNILLSDTIQMLPNAYNVIYNLAYMKNPLELDAVFVHFAGSAKPWQCWTDSHPLAELYRIYKKESPWATVSIQKPKTYKQAKFMARAYRRNKKYILAIRWYLKYSLWKMTRKY